MRSSSGLLWFGLCEDAQEIGARARYASRVDVVFIDRDISATLLDSLHISVIVNRSARKIQFSGPANLQKCSSRMADGVFRCPMFPPPLPFHRISAAARRTVIVSGDSEGQPT
jgi:hypothetical protein